MLDLYVLLILHDIIILYLSLHKLQETYNLRIKMNSSVAH